MPRGDNYEAKRAEARMEKLKAVTEEAATLHSYGWVDKEKGVARIPIERAMELSVTELAQKKPMPAGPIATPPPAPAEPAAVVPTAPAAATPTPASSPAHATTHSGPGSVIGTQPAAAANPQDAPPGTQPGPNATPGRFTARARRPGSGSADRTTPPRQRHRNSRASSRPPPSATP